MNITFTLTSWCIPAIITIIAFSGVAFTAFTERNDSGIMSGLGTAISFVIALFVTACSWITWLLVNLFNK